MRNPLSAQREKLELTQGQMAAFLKTVQSEISKTESGELPPNADIKRWAKAYRLTVRKFVSSCSAAQWALPLWKYAYRTPADVEFITVKIPTFVATMLDDVPVAAMRKQA